MPRGGATTPKSTSETLAPPEFLFHFCRAVKWHPLQFDGTVMAGNGELMAGTTLDLLKPEYIFFGVEAPDRNVLFTQLERRLRPLGVITDDWLQKIVSREEQYPTGLQTSTIAIALPHADNCVVEPYISVVKPLHAVVFEPMANIGSAVEASLVVNLGLTRDGGQVEALQELMNLFMSEDAVEDIMRQTTGDGMVSAFRRHIH